MTYQSFFELFTALDGYIDEISPYVPNYQDTPFPCLPLELREQIYGHVLFSANEPEWPTRIYFFSACGSQRFHLPNICKVNEATRIEVGLFLIRNVNWELHSVEAAYYLNKLLESMPGEQGFMAMRSLSVPASFFGEIPRQYRDLLSKCTAMPTLRFCFKTNEVDLLGRKKFRIQKAHSMLSDAVNSWRLEVLLPICPSLSRIYLALPRVTVVGSGFGCVTLASEVAALARQVVERCGSDIDVLPDEL